MKNRRLISVMAAVLTGITVTAIPAVPDAAFSMTASAEEDPGEMIYGVIPGECRYRYYENEDEVIFTKYLGYDSDYTVPDKIEGRTVRVIDLEAFQNKSMLKTVTLPSTIHYIGDYAFSGCGITKITLPSALTYIGHYAFAESGLTSVMIPTFVQTVNTNAFRHCKSLKTVKIKGKTELKENAFCNCPKLESVTISASATAEKGVQVFRDVPNLMKVNGGPVYTMQPDQNGISRPVINPELNGIVKKIFSGGLKIGFVDSYCTDMCNYVVASETDAWMGDGLKARQLHDWLIRHCAFEDYKNGEKYDDPDNYAPSSVFLSAGVNARGTGIGESVCVGYAKAYSMLLAAAGIESRTVSGCPCLGKGGRVWNAVKIDGQYYECDVALDDVYGTVGQYGTSYTAFMKNDQDMQQCHGGSQKETKMYDCHLEHPLLCYTGSVLPELLQNPQSYRDINSDGILDEDYDLDGKAGTDDFEDLIAGQMLCAHPLFLYGYNTDVNGKLPELLHFLRQQKQSFWEYVK